MAVQAVFLRAVTDPVLDHRDDTRGVDAVPAVLKAFDISGDEFPRHIRVFPERAADARPARLRRQVGLRRKGLFDPSGAVFLARYVGKPPYQRCVSNRGKTQRLGPLRESSRLHARAERALEMVSGVGADGEWDAEPRTLGNLLQSVVLCGQ